MKLQLALFLCCILQLSYGRKIRGDSRLDFRIVGGQEAPDNVAPYGCSLQFKRKHMCGAAIISSRYLVTAAHCVFGLATADLDVLVGTNDLELSKGGKYYRVKAVKMHDNYADTGFPYDIAVVEVSKEIEFNDQVQPIQYTAEEIPDGEEAVFTGWGKIRLGLKIPDRLQILTTNVMSTEKCQNSTLGVSIHESHFCTFKKIGKGACTGDSGGPLVRNNMLIGVANFVKPCAKGVPDVFGKISYFYDWIKKNTA